MSTYCAIAGCGQHVKRRLLCGHHWECWDRSLERGALPRDPTELETLAALEKFIVAMGPVKKGGMR
jgi:hypothetical protein